MQGSLEIIESNGTSTGVVGADWTPAAVPVVLGALYGMTNVDVATPTAAATGRLPDGQWTARTPTNQEVIVRLWREIPHEETYAAAIGPDLVKEE